MCPPDALVCEDFERHALGTAPGAPWRASGTPQVTGTRAFRGTKAVLTERGELIRLDLQPTRELVFGRMMMWMEGSPVEHWSFAVSGNGGYSARYGQQRRYGKQIMSNYHWIGGEAEFVSRTPIPTGRWVCVEWSFDRPRRQFQFWMDGLPMMEASGAYTNRPAIPGPWTFMAVGQEVYGHPDMSHRIYLDEVAFATARIACP